MQSAIYAFGTVGGDVLLNNKMPTFAKRLLKAQGTSDKYDIRSLTTLANSLSVSRSSRMLDVLVVMSSMYSFSIGWYTYLTLSVSTKVCWRDCCDDDEDDDEDEAVVISFGNAASSPSMRDLVISTNCRERRALPDLVHTAEARRTWEREIKIW